MKLVAVMIVLVLVMGAMAAIAAPPAHAAPPAQAREVDDNDDTRVEVQLVVLGVVAASVVGVLGAAYFVRKRLGLVPPPPEQPDSHH